MKPPGPLASRTGLTRRPLRRGQPMARHQAPSGPGERRARRLVAQRSRGICECCGVERAESWAHRVPRSQGGPWTPENGLHACGDGTRGCHGWIEHNPLAANLLGWRLWRDQDPASTPLLLHRQLLVLPTADGGWESAEKPRWFESDVDRDCPCGALIRDGDPAARLPGAEDAVCLDCADRVEKLGDVTAATRPGSGVLGALCAWFVLLFCALYVGTALLRWAMS